ncbi:MAG TPA: electron transfer flavoprotein subunit beta/FixA family protein [Trueperaceae bacterium]|nr:electron transfer flavoprotein subunit beta/FixA family protein [Trueperaceae bacterium]
MKLLTVVRQVPDAEARVRAEGGRVDLAGVTFVMDGMDEYGVEEAIRLREAGNDLEIVAVAVGPERFQDALRTALALGADRAVHVVTDEPLDPITLAGVLAQVSREEDADLVMTGGKQADWDSAALGPALAEHLGWPHSDWTTSLELSGSELRLRHDVDNGTEELTLTLPAVVTTQQGLNEPRYPTLPNIMKAKRKELTTRPLSEVAEATPRVKVVSQEIQVRPRMNRVLSGTPEEAAAELARLLRAEAKVI